MQGGDGTQKEARRCPRLGGDSSRMPTKLLIDNSTSSSVNVCVIN